MARMRILLVQLFSNGDCLYATAVARQIRHDYPSCHLTWAISSGCREMIRENPHIDDVMEVNDVPRNNERAFRKFMARVSSDKR